MKKYKNGITFLKAHKIAEEAIEVMQKKEGEYPLLDKYLLSNSYSADFIQNITNEKRISTYNRPEKYDRVKLLEERMVKRGIRRQRIKRITISSLAVAATLFAIAILLFPAEKKSKPILASDPRNSVPMLILENGDTMNLNSNEIQLNGVENRIAMIKETVSYNTIIVPANYTYTIILSDSSEVILNAESQLRYPTAFNDKDRKVYLTGEAYFKVKKNSLPFIVETADVSVKVYGTLFNVNTFNGETLLVSGSVGVSPNNGKDEIFMKPSELCTYSAGEFTIQTVECENYVAWIDHFFKCDDEELNDLLTEIARWYGIQFVFETQINCKISSLLLKRTLEVETILKAIEEISNVKFIKNGDKKYVVR